MGVILLLGVSFSVEIRLETAKPRCLISSQKRVILIIFKVDLDQVYFCESIL